MHRRAKIQKESVDAGIKNGDARAQHKPNNYFIVSNIEYSCNRKKKRKKTPPRTLFRVKKSETRVGTT